MLFCKHIFQIQTEGRASYFLFMTIPTAKYGVAEGIDQQENSICNGSLNLKKRSPNFVSIIPNLCHMAE